ncbi:hypothetical protein CFAM422_006787 [Trichoderma lentiforme]|uniref:Uncharacterized protein n=1 Tax=Trichoderma lentiforme TaxID=1567552 RepID=A0A9P4XEF8_9HYPO|nr:hypothetical protein CFAM422_006787 [Trichoderma lentiforme]
MSNSGLPLDATITIVNNSGKLISTGKQLLSIWKTAQTSYQQKRDELSQERAQERAKPPPVPIKRAQTFDTSRSIPHRQYDELSVASSHRTFKSSIAKKQLPPVPNQLALTEGNLEKLSEVSSVAPSKPPSSYQGSYGDAMLVKSGFSRVDPPMALQTVQPRPLVRTRTDTEAEAMKRMSMGSDLHLAYGDIPPDLADRVDLDVHTAPPHVDLRDVHVEDEREQAEQLIHKIENLLDEASCAQHSATAIITHLQERPDAAAAVALTLAELSGIITKLSPGFAAILKGTSPAIFALLASPQFLIGTGIAVGVTVVMFGGWKIIQRATQNSFAKKPLAYEAAAAAPVPNLPALPESGIDEAIVLESVEVDISSIDTWRRGIVDLGYESADQELMTPAAERVRRSSKAGSEDYFSRKGSKSHRSSSSKTHSSSQSTSSSSHKSHKSRHEKDSSDKKSSGSSGSSKKSDDTSSVGSMALIKKSIASRKKQIDQTGIKSEELPLRTKKQTNMLKALFKSKEHRQTVAT